MMPCAGHTSKCRSPSRPYQGSTTALVPGPAAHPKLRHRRPLLRRVEARPCLDQHCSCDLSLLCTFSSCNAFASRR
jgi:hypothetical protein